MKVPFVASVTLVAVVLSAAVFGQQPSPAAPVLKMTGSKAKAHGKELASLALSPDGTLLASGFDDGVIKLWTVTSGQPVQTLKSHQDRVTDLAFTGDGRILAAASEDKTITIWSVADRKLLATARGHSTWVGAVLASPDGTMLLSGSEKELRGWSLPNGRPLGTMAVESQSLSRAVFLPDGKAFAFPTGNDIRLVSLPDLADAGRLECGSTDRIGPRPAITPDGTRLIALCGTNLTVWSLGDRRQIATIAGDDERINLLRVSADGAVAVTASPRNGVRIWQLATGRAGMLLRGHKGLIASLAIAPSGAVVASGADDETVVLWSVKDERAMATLEGHRGSVDHLHFTPDGTTLISAQESTFVITGASGGSIGLRKVNADALIALWDLNPLRFRSFLK